ncbi:MAG: MBOAT family O-acyltransferase [Bacillota bacterium]
MLSRIMLKSTSSAVSKISLLVGILFNVGVLVYFKYYDFFVSNINFVFGTDWILLNLMLPLGISFFTFQQLSYVIDSYRKAVPVYNILDYSLFVTFFPQLVAGPIVLHSEMVPQFEDVSNKKLNAENIYKGLYIFACGLGKKVLLADAFGVIVSWGFGDIASLGTTNALIVMLSYTLQIYLDFSGYCDMATGIALFFNIKLPMNFNSPYKALNIVDFWKRWHMTLTRFFTTYVYIPLGGNRVKKSRMYFNTAIVFLVSGLWHGANWTFIVWGSLHGIAIVLNKLFKNKIENLNIVLSWILTFIFINLTWVIFRADTLVDAWAFYGQIFSLNFTSVSDTIWYAFQISDVAIMIERYTMAILANKVYAVLLFIVVMLCIIKCKNAYLNLEYVTANWINTIVYSIIIVYAILSFSGISAFLYFNF